MAAQLTINHWALRTRALFWNRAFWVSSWDVPSPIGLQAPPRVGALPSGKSWVRHCFAPCLESCGPESSKRQTLLEDLRIRLSEWPLNTSYVTALFAPKFCRSHKGSFTLSEGEKRNFSLIFAAAKYDHHIGCSFGPSESDVAFAFHPIQTNS